LHMHIGCERNNWTGHMDETNYDCNHSEILATSVTPMLSTSES